VVFVPTAGLHAMPWGLLPSLARVPVRVAPSAAAWLRTVESPANGTGRIVFAAGPALPAARAEVVAIAEKIPGAETFVADEATVPAVLSAMDGADLVHIAAHGHLRIDNPLLSALELVDGPLTVYDLEHLARAPTTVILPACRSGVTAVHAGDEIMGLVSALLTLGARTVIATVTPVSDEDTQSLMVALHDQLRCGVPPAEALVAARAATNSEEAGAVAAGASFICFGA
jgi:CHAT domain-containing protein